MAFIGDGGVALDADDLFGDESKANFINLEEEGGGYAGNTATGSESLRERAVHANFYNNFGDIFDDDDIE